MWIFTNKSFLSIVQHREKPGIFLVRAREKGDIESAFGNSVVVNQTEIADYRYRAEVKHKVVIAMMMREMNKIDYDNFKNSIDKDDKERHDAYMGVWHVMNQYQYRNDQYEFSFTESYENYGYFGGTAEEPITGWEEDPAETDQIF